MVCIDTVLLNGISWSRNYLMSLIADAKGIDPRFCPKGLADHEVIWIARRRAEPVINRLRLEIARERTHIAFHIERCLKECNRRSLKAAYEILTYLKTMESLVNEMYRVRIKHVEVRARELKRFDRVFWKLMARSRRNGARIEILLK